MGRLEGLYLVMGITEITRYLCKIETPTAKEEGVKTRHYTVSYTPNRGKPNPNPQLTFSGKCLSELGFTVSSNVTLTRQAGQLIIRLAKGE